MGDSFVVIMAAYQSVGQAQKDFDALVGLVQGKQVKTEGVILVEHDADGEVTVSADRGSPGPQGRWAGAAGSASSWACSRRRCWPRWRWARRPAR